ncbi:hypothetical protein PGT21_014425 [Puccinia graminis f. sp. tritici]|uniref:Uncharacterized protein n=1 Tax=Puccinia graminis f. sp. tritici TaxID=56615 RepID=A0A5B0LKJ2_PUCGR|nr:hypothetical protein PGTUg99_014979 [Puccinia graminis f. sp. tritici]KAA1090814.1 hypothetical protein PGT21_014425 [Puccinia graminis f. sp. tritici]
MTRSTNYKYSGRRWYYLITTIGSHSIGNGRSNPIGVLPVYTAGGLDHHISRRKLLDRRACNADGGIAL